MTKILIVDDEEAMLSLVCLLLSAEGIDPIEARSVEEALELVTPELAGLVTDMHIGSRLGTEVLEKFREICPKVPAVLMSGKNHHPLTNEPLHETAKRMKARFLPKPFVINDLCSIFRPTI